MNHAIILISLSLLTFTFADLCTKCYKSDTEGTWIFYLSPKTYPRDLFNSNIRCGHPQPNAPKLPVHVPIDDPKEIQVTFSSPNNFNIYDYSENGWWTMIYSIGFWGRTPNYEFFGQFSFDQKQNNTDFYDCKSICGKIVDSWYIDRSTGKIGCFYGRKIKLFEDEYDEEEEEEIQNYKHKKENNNLDDIKYEDLKFLVDKINMQTDKSWTAIINEEYAGKTLKTLLNLISRNPLPNTPSLQNIINYLKPSEQLILPKSSYFLKDFSESLKHSGFVIDTSDPLLKYWYMHIDDIPDSAIPKNWDWRNVNGISYINPTRSQGKCGSCYILGSLSVIESRVRIATKNLLVPNLSSQQLLSCSFYSEGCKGGEAILVGKFGMDFEYISNDCFPYTANAAKCKYQCFNTGIARIGAAFASYIGDYKESPEMNEKRIMKEVRARGPITVGIVSPLLLRYYNSGIIACNDLLLPRESLSETEEEILRRIKEGFRPVEHLVVLAGWGETEKKEKYWIIQNSWGEKYGDNGYFLLKRGGNECAIETDAVALYPKIIY